MSDVAMRPPIRQARVNDETPLVRYALIGVAALFLLLILFLPLIAVFAEAFRRGVGPYLNALTDPDTTATIKLTLLVAFISVAFNIVVGVSAAWAIAKFHF